MKKLVLLLLLIQLKTLGQTPVKSEVVVSSGELSDGVVSTIKNTQDNTYTYAIKGINQSLGIYSAGVFGESPNGVGVWGKSNGNGWAVFGSSISGFGIIGTSESNAGGVFQSSSGPALLTSGGPVGINTIFPKYQMTFKTELGDKISFWGGETSNVTPHYGIGIQGGMLQYFVPTTGDNHVFGVGRSGAFSEKFRITGNGNLQNSGIDAGYRFYDRNTLSKSFQWYSINGNAYLFRHHNGSGNILSVLENGNVGIGTDTPQSKLHVNGKMILNGGLSVGGGETLSKIIKKVDTQYIGNIGAQSNGCWNFVVPGALPGDMVALSLYSQLDSKIIIRRSFVEYGDEVTVCFNNIGNVDVTVGNTSLLFVLIR